MTRKEIIATLVGALVVFLFMQCPRDTGPSATERAALDSLAASRQAQSQLVDRLGLVAELADSLNTETARWKRQAASMATSARHNAANAEDLEEQLDALRTSLGTDSLVPRPVVDELLSSARSTAAEWKAAYLRADSAYWLLQERVVAVQDSTQLLILQAVDSVNAFFAAEAARDAAIARGLQRSTCRTGPWGILPCPSTGQAAALGIVGGLVLAKALR